MSYVIETMTDDQLRQELARWEESVRTAPGFVSALESAKLLKKIVAEGNRRGLGFVNRYPIRKG